MNHLLKPFTLTALFLLLSFYVGAQKDKAPNIIIILTDDMGYGDLSCYGNPLIKTPNLDRMADEGIRLTSFYVAANACTPSRAALLTGRYPLRSGLPYVLFPKEDNGLHASEITLAEILKEQGYRTMCVGKWHLGQTRKEFMPASQGFDHYFGLITSNDMMKPWVQTDVSLHLYRDLEPINEFPVDQKTLTTRYTEEAIRFIKSAGNTPFFLYLPHNMPHVPVSTTSRFEGKSAGGLYGDVIETIDWSTGEILKTLKENKLDKNTIVIFLSDNGPWNNMPPRMFAENIVKPWDAGTAGLLRGGKGTTYEGGHRVPCIIRWPGKIPAGQVSPQTAVSIDLYTTLARAAGGSTPQDRIIDGVDIMPLLSGKDTAFQRGKDFYYFEGKFLEAVRSGDWKLRLAPFIGEDMLKNEKLEPQLYNLAVDPSERVNQAEQHPEIVAELRKKMLDFEIEGAVKRFK